MCEPDIVPRRDRQILQVETARPNGLGLPLVPTRPIGRSTLVLYGGQHVEDQHIRRVVRQDGILPSLSSVGRPRLKQVADLLFIRPIRWWHHDLPSEI